MIQKVKGVVLHHIKYKESSAIVYVYTDLFGRQSYLVNSIRGKKTKFSSSFLQPFTLLEIEAYHKEGKDLQRLIEMRNYIPFRSIPFDHHKSSQALFLSEVLYKVLREEDPNPELFKFLEHSLQLLDISDEGTVNFHLIFLVQLTKFMGFIPENNFGGEKTGFDMRNGQFSNGTGLHPDYFDKHSSALLHELLETGFGGMTEISVNQNVRVKFLEDMMDYYRLHLHGFGKVNSLSVLSEIYSDENEI
ncbi:MAG TPA: DNA repair protein RecO [Bacteroides sp.]|nr:DNA repair protein RecO [Bacteroides sp.]